MSDCKTRVMSCGHFDRWTWRTTHALCAPMQAFGFTGVGCEALTLGLCRCLPWRCFSWPWWLQFLHWSILCSNLSPQMLLELKSILCNEQLAFGGKVGSGKLQYQPDMWATMNDFFTTISQWSLGEWDWHRPISFPSKDCNDWSVGEHIQKLHALFTSPCDVHISEQAHQLLSLFRLLKNFNDPGMVGIIIALYRDV